MLQNRAHDWLKQAENDFKWAQDSLKNKYYSQACFIAQQVGEKALKALAYYRSFDLIKTHSISEIAKSLALPDDIILRGKKLYIYYISTRYPDAFPSGAPYEYFTEDQATEPIYNA